MTLTLKMTTAQVVETSVTVNNNSPIQDYVHPDNQTQPTFEMTPGFKPFTITNYRAFSHDVTAAILVFQNNETAAMLVYQQNLLGVERFSHVNAFFCSNKLA